MRRSKGRAAGRAVAGVSAAIAAGVLGTLVSTSTADPLLTANRQLHDAMTRLRIPHHYEEYDGDHTNKVRDRIEFHVLPFFSKNLAAPANPTSPRPNNETKN